MTLPASPVKVEVRGGVISSVQVVVRGGQAYINMYTRHTVWRPGENPGTRLIGQLRISAPDVPVLVEQLLPGPTLEVTEQVDDTTVTIYTAAPPKSDP